LTIKNYL